MKLYTGIFLVLASATTMADDRDCGTAFIEIITQQKQLIAASERVKKDYDYNSSVLLTQLEQLTNDLSSAEQYSKVSHYIKNNCNSFRTDDKIGDKNIAYAQVLGSQGASTFYEYYIKPNDTWADAYNSLKNDMLSKKNELKISIHSSIEKEETNEAARKDALIIELEELKKLKDLVVKSKNLEIENAKLDSTVSEIKSELANSKYDGSVTTTAKVTETVENIVQNNSYKEGQSSFYLKSDSIFCLTENQFDFQIDLLAQGIDKSADYCYLSAYNVDIVVINYGMLGKTKVRSIVDGTTMWITTESIGRR